ncbi:MAG: T9SS type A sorting domain-containing protein [Bacteroidetes bacterium]|nr:T9SS type A sorting domain-containing protein [Bacteroidota bacterium]
MKNLNPQKPNWHFAFFLSCVLSLLSYVSFAQSICFDPAADNRFESGIYPQQVAKADFNNDTKLDIAAANSIGGGVSVLFGNGDGTFATPFALTTSSTFPECIVAADFNSDNKPDIIVMERGSNPELELYINNGNGTFASAIPFSFNAGGTSVEMRGADFDNDGKIDLVVNNYGLNKLYILKNNANSTLTVLDSLNTTGQPTYIAVGDLNNDNRPDIAVGGFYSAPNNDSIYYYINNGNGTFNTGGYFVLGITGAYYHDLAIGDINNDNFGDLIVEGAADIRVYLNNGSLVFALQPIVQVGGYAFEILIADVNGDTKKDIIEVDQSGGTVVVALGNNNGTFQPYNSYSTNGKPYHAMLGDFDGDTRNDLVSACRDNSYITILKGNADGSFGSYSLRTGLHPDAIATGFVNNDAFEDLVTVNSQSKSINTMLGNGDGTFQPTIFDSVWIGAADIVLGDFNNDTKTDAVMIGQNTTTILSGDNTGHFTIVSDLVYGLNATQDNSGAVGDFNHDNKLDLVISGRADDSVAVLLGNGNFTFATPLKYGVGDYPRKITAFHMNADNNLDLLVPNDLGNSVSLLLGNSNGTFQPAVTISTGGGPRAIAAEDFNNDGLQDFAATCSNASSIDVHLATAPGVFAAPVSYTVGANGSEFITTAFINADTLVDLILTKDNANQVGVFIGNANGTFQNMVTYSVDNGPYELVSADFNNDNVDDIASVNYGAGNVSVILNNSAFITASGNTAICTGDSVQLTASGGFTYLWSTGATTPSIYVNSAATYSCSVTNQAGTCTVIPPSVAVTVSGNTPTVTYDISNSDRFCISSGTLSLVLTGGSPQGGTYSGSFINNGVFNLTQAGVGAHLVTYTYTDPGGCGTASDNDSLFIDNEVLASINFPSDTFCDNVGQTVLAPFGSPAGGAWGVNNTVITTVNPSQAGVGTYFMHYAIVAGGCKDTAYVTAVVEHCTGINELDETVLNIYPNPSKGTFVISIANDQKFSLVRIFDATGRKQMESTLTDNKILLSELARGTYLVELSNEKTVVRKQVVVQ